MQQSLYSRFRIGPGFPDSVRTCLLHQKLQVHELPNILCNAYVTYVSSLRKKKMPLASFLPFARVDDELLHSKEEGEGGERA